MKKLFNISLFIWLTIMLVFPSILTIEKFLLVMFLSVLVVIIKIIEKDYKVNLKSLLIIILVISVGLFFLIYGYIKTGKIYYKLIEMFILTPIISVIIASNFKDKKDYLWLTNSIIIITFVIVVYDSIYIIGRMGIIPQLIKPEIAGSFVMTGEKIEARITNQSSLIFLLPMLINLYLLKYKKLKKIILLTIILGIFVTIMSGRRALQLAVILSILFLAIINLKKKFILNKQKIIIGLIFTIVVVMIGYCINFINLDKINHFFDIVYQTFISAFDLKNTESGQIRALQSRQLINGWGNSPLIGYGLGTHPDYIRSIETPWSYEMVYLSFLYQIGIFGMMFYFGIIISIFIKLYRIYKQDSYFFKYNKAVGISFLCFIIAGATNPLVFYLWAWIIVLSYCNIKKI